MQYRGNNHNDFVAIIAVWYFQYHPTLHQSDDTIDDAAKVIGVRMVIYINDILILARIKEETTQHFLLKSWGLWST